MDVRREREIFREIRGSLRNIGHGDGSGARKASRAHPADMDGGASEASRAHPADMARDSEREADCDCECDIEQQSVVTNAIFDAYRTPTVTLRSMRLSARSLRSRSRYSPGLVIRAGKARRDAQWLV